VYRSGGVDWAGLVLRVKDDNGTWHAINTNTSGVQIIPNLKHQHDITNDNEHCGFLPFPAQKAVDFEYAIVKFEDFQPGDATTFNTQFSPGTGGWSNITLRLHKNYNINVPLSPYTFTKSISNIKTPLGVPVQYNHEPGPYNGCAYLPSFDGSVHSTGAMPGFPYSTRIHSSYTSQFPSIGSTSGYIKQFGLVFKGCTHVAAIQYKLQSPTGPSPAPSLGLLNNESTAHGVAIQILHFANGQWLPAPLETWHTQNNNQQYESVVYFAARLYRTGALGSGAVASWLRILIQYP